MTTIPHDPRGVFDQMVAAIDPDKKYPHQYSEVIDLTPRLAAELLANKAPNRSIKPRHLARIEASLAKGERLVTHQGIALDWFGRLVDGQHRCQAVVNTGIPMRVQITYGLDPAAFKYMDDGSDRLNSDTLHVAGYEGSSRIPGIIQLVRQYDEKPTGAWDRQRVRMDADEILEWAIKFGDLHPFITLGDQMRRGMGNLGYAPVFSAVAYVVDRDSGLSLEDLRPAFWEPMMTGAGMDLGDPRLAFTRFARNTYQNRTGSTMSQMRPHFGALIKTYNAWILGKPVKMMAFKDSEALPVVVSGGEVAAAQTIQ
jgi:hypothetical protein